MLQVHDNEISLRNCTDAHLGVEMAWAAKMAVSGRFTYGPVNRPNTFILSWVPLRSANVFEARTRMLRKIFSQT